VEELQEDPGQEPGSGVAHDGAGQGAGHKGASDQELAHGDLVENRPPPEECQKEQRRGLH
jgi:hypothetical protein